MKTRSLRTLRGGLLPALFPFLFLAATWTSHAAGKPNFVWLVSEDNSKHYLKLFDTAGAETPHIAELAREGLLFEHAFSNGAVCSVARTTLITGCYGPRIGTQFHRKSVPVPMPEGLRMFPAYLKEAGYYTANNQKKDYNAIEGPDVWDASSRQASWRGRREGQPFFYFQSFVVTHESSLHFTTATFQNEKTQTDPATINLAPYHPDTPLFRYTYARYHDRIKEMDQQIGRVVEELKRDGLLEETFIFYFGDHGGVLPGSKGYAYESGLHVPLVIRVPEKWRHLVNPAPGTRMEGFVSFVDFGPTLLHLAGIPVPEAMDGQAFLGKDISDLNGRDETFGHADRFDEKYDLVRTLRKGKWKYIRSYQPFNFDGLHNDYRYRMLAYQEWRALHRTGKLNASQSQFFRTRPPEALYNLEHDPHETRNLATDPAHAQVVRDLRRRLADRVRALPDLSFYPESHLVEEAFDNPVEFGRTHRKSIARLVEIADLQLIPFQEAQAEIRAALGSDNPWERYWGCIVCSSHGAAASAFVTQTRTLATEDPQPLVRVRAAEFLGLIGAEDPRPTIKQALAESKSIVQSGLILNTVVLLQDGKPGYDFGLTKADVMAPEDSNDLVGRRLHYLVP